MFTVRGCGSFLSGKSTTRGAEALQIKLTLLFHHDWLQLNCCWLFFVSLRLTFDNVSVFFKCRIERLWREVWTGVTHLLWCTHSLEEDGFLIISDTLHLFCAQHSFLPSLNVDFFSVVCHDTHPGVLESPLKAEDVESLHLDIDPLVPSSSFRRDISWTALSHALYLHHHPWESQLGPSQGEVIRTSYFTKSSLRFLNHWWHWDSFLNNLFFCNIRTSPAFNGTFHYFLVHSRPKQMLTSWHSHMEEGEKSDKTNDFSEPHV